MAIPGGEVMALDLAKLRELAPHEKFVTTPRATWLALLALLDRLEAAEKACAIAVEGCTNNWDTQVGELPLDQTLPGRLRAALISHAHETARWRSSA